MPDAVDTVVCAPDDGWRYHPKHVEQFPDIKCVTLRLVGYMYQNILTMHGPMNVKCKYSKFGSDRALCVKTNVRFIVAGDLTSP